MLESLKQRLKAIGAVQKQRPIAPPTLASAVQSRTAGKRILIISNCQVQVLKHGLAATCLNTECESVPVHVIAPQDRKSLFNSYIAVKNGFDLILTIRLSEEFGAFATDKIANAFAPIPVLGISNINFNGTHPDICYIGGMNERTPGPLGDYHSQLALFGYLLGLTEEQTVRLYDDRVYRCLGYYDAFAESLAEMASRDEQTDIPVGDLLETKVRQGICFLSHNHPTPLLMAAYINRIAQELDSRGQVKRTGLELCSETLINFLAQSSIFPIFPEIAAHHNLPYKGDYIFRTPTVGDVPSRPLSLPQFVAGEFTAFRHADQATLKEHWPGVMLSLKHKDNVAFMAFVATL